MKRISPKEIEIAEREGNASVPSYGSGAAEHRQAIYKAIAQAQLDSCKKESREIFEGLERYKRSPEQFDPKHPLLRTGDIYIPSESYQTLKQKHLARSAPLPER